MDDIVEWLRERSDYLEIEVGVGGNSVTVGLLRDAADRIARADSEIAALIEENACLIEANDALRERIAELQADADRGWKWVDRFVNWGHLLPETESAFRGDKERHFRAQF